MISLAIAATLLTAVAVAFSATTAAIGENDTFFKATHTGRVALNRVLTHVRRGSVDEESTGNNIRIITDSGADVTYKYLPSTKQLMFITNGDKTDPDYVLARNVESATFSFEMGEDHEGLPCIARDAVTMTVQVGKNSVLLSGAAAPRRNLRF